MAWYFVKHRDNLPLSVPEIYLYRISSSTADYTKTIGTCLKI